MARHRTFPLAARAVSCLLSVLLLLTLDLCVSGESSPDLAPLIPVTLSVAAEVSPDACDQQSPAPKVVQFAHLRLRGVAAEIRQGNDAPSGVTIPYPDAGHTDPPHGFDQYPQGSGRRAAGDTCVLLQVFLC